MNIAIILVFSLVGAGPTALAFTPTHQEACCLAMLKNEPLDSLKCEELRLSPDLCTAIVDNFTKAAMSQTKRFEGKTREPQPQKIVQPVMPKNLILSVLAALLLLLGGFMVRRRWADKNTNTPALKPLATMLLAVINSLLLGWLSAVISLKVLCSLGNLCKTSNILIFYTIPAIVFAFCVGIYFLRYSWKNRINSLLINIYVLIASCASVLTIYLLKLEIG